MAIDSRRLANWLIIGAAFLALLVYGRVLLVPLLFAVIFWSLLNSLSESLQKIGLPGWLSLVISLAASAAALYVIARILGNEAAAMVSRGPDDIAKLQTLVTSWFAFLHLGHVPNLSDLISRSDAVSVLQATASSAGNFLFELTLIAFYLAFLLFEQHYLPTKIASVVVDGESRQRVTEVIHTIAGQLQSYIGVCTLLSALMAGATYLLLTVLGIDFAGFWALIMFLLTYIPTIGTFGVLFPALMGLVQFGSLETFLIVSIVLGAVHFVLADVIQPVMLGRSLNLSSLWIILSLSFWGMIWGVEGLFLAVPITAALAIVCSHIDGLHWVTVVLAGPPPKHKRVRAAKVAK